MAKKETSPELTEEFKKTLEMTNMIDVEVDGVKADSVRGDGVIVATATGSTAYSLSCNGPVVAPDVKAFVINAICPHSLHFCPLVVSDSSVITLTGDGSKMRVTVDGRVYPAGGGDCRVTIRKSGRSAMSAYCATSPNSGGMKVVPL